MNTKYILLSLLVFNGEYQYSVKSVHELPNRLTSTGKRCAYNYAREFYMGKVKKVGHRYYFHGGEVIVEVQYWQFISETDFLVLKKYL